MKAHKCLRILIVGLLCGCVYRWEQLPVPIDPGAAPRGRADLRLVLSDGQRLELRRGRVEADSVVGYGEARDSLDAGYAAIGNPPPRRITVPLDQVRTISVRRLDGTLTTVAVAVGVGGAVALLRLWARSTLRIGF